MAVELREEALVALVVGLDSTVLLKTHQFALTIHLRHLGTQRQDHEDAAVLYGRKDVL
jgi:hypothetical protein